MEEVNNRLMRMFELGATNNAMFQSDVRTLTELVKEHFVKSSSVTPIEQPALGFGLNVETTKVTSEDTNK